MAVRARGGANLSQKVDALQTEAATLLAEGRRIESVEIGRKALEIDATHLDTHWVVARALVPEKGSIGLEDASSSFAHCEYLVNEEPSRAEAWVQGGALLTHQLGMVEEALAWWQGYREICPTDPRPLLQQISILADLGLYDETLEQFTRIVDDGVESLPVRDANQMRHLHMTVSEAARSSRENWFRPWNESDKGWDVIRTRMTRRPANESVLFLLLVAPVMWFEAWFITARPMAVSGWLMAMGLIFLTFIFGMRMTRGMTRRLNLPAMNLIRAMEVETSSGRVVIPEDIRASKLYGAILLQRPPALRDRHDRIAALGRPLASGWRPHVPDLSSADDALEEVLINNGRAELSIEDELEFSGDLTPLTDLLEEE